MSQDLRAIALQNNKSAGELMLDMIRQTYPNYHPILSIAHIAHRTEDERVELSCHQTIAKYVQPELKSIEIRAKVETQKRVIVEMFSPELAPPVVQEDIIIDAVIKRGMEFGVYEALRDESDES